MPRLRVGFAGTPSFAAQALDAVLEAGFPVPVVLTQPDRPSGRGLSVQPSPVKVLAGRHGLTVLQPPSLRAEEGRRDALAIDLDVLVVAAYGLILPPSVLAWPRYGGLNIHASLLPRWRGAAPIQHALLAGDPATGITIMQMDAGLDTGPMIDRVETAIDPRDTAGSLTERLAQMGAAAIVRALRRLEADRSLAATPQPLEGVTYAGKVARADAELDWKQPAVALLRRIRAFDPAPGAFTSLGADTVKVWSAAVATGGAAAPGTVVDVGGEGLDVACGEGTLRLHTVQPAGGKRMSAAAFAAGRGVVRGAVFGR